MTSPATRARRATTSPLEDEAGFTLAELLVTMLVMGIVASSVMMVALRTFTTTATVTNRRDVLADGRTALDRLSKQLRQAESIDSSCPESTDSPSRTSSIAFSGYIDGSASAVAWQVTGSSAPYALEESVGGGNFVPVVSSLADDQVFQCSTDASLIDQVSVRLPLETTTTTVVMTTDVQLRNVSDES
jgi:prepilin-type N-terminal cleavage/methylation domain-containing protein